MTNYVATLMIMASVIYGLIFSPVWVLCFPAAIALVAIRSYFKNQK